MSSVKFLFIILVFIISSCDYLEKNSSSKEEKLEERLVFVGEMPEITTQKVTKISKTIVNKLKELKGFCKGPASIQKIKKFVSKLSDLQTYSKKSYYDNRFSINSVHIKNGVQDVKLSLYLLEIESVLKKANDMTSANIRNSNLNVNEACNKLQDNYRFSYAAQYNLADNVQATDVMTFIFKSIDNSISCLCQ